MGTRQVETVSGPHDAIKVIQDDFLKHPEFVYFRKGEFTHALEVAWMYMNVIAPEAARYGVSVAAGITVTLFKEKLERWRKESAKTSTNRSTSTQYDLRFIMCDENSPPDRLIGTEALCEMGWKRGLIPPEQTGRIRYFVSSKGYFLFFRNRDGSFHGILGHDPETRDCLRNQFLDEWLEMRRVTDMHRADG